MTFFNKTFQTISDAHTYAHHVFQAFDINRNGSISFRVSKELGIGNVRKGPTRQKSGCKREDEKVGIFFGKLYRAM